VPPLDQVGGGAQPQPAATIFFFPFLLKNNNCFFFNFFIKFATCRHFIGVDVKPNLSQIER
jgi:hypothetical protein